MIQRRVYLRLGFGVLTLCVVGFWYGLPWSALLVLGVLWTASLWGCLRFGVRETLKIPPPPAILCPQTNEPCPLATLHRDEMHRAVADLEMRNRDLERFASMTAHQLRSPPRTIAGIAQALHEDYGHLLDAEGTQFLQDIREDAASMAEIVDGLYRVSKVRTMTDLPLEPVDLNELLADMKIAKTKRGLLRPQDRLTWAHLPVVKADKVLLTEVFLNLLENSLKFNESPNKVIRITARERDDDRWDIMVKDNGIGIDPKYQPKMFQMFQRMHPQYKGTGVGLALVSAIIQKLGGDVHVQSTTGKGCMFTFDLASAEMVWAQTSTPKA